MIEKRRKDFSRQLETWRKIEASMAKRQASAARRMIEAIDRKTQELEQNPDLIEEMNNFTRFVQSQISLWESANKTMHSALAFEELLHALESNDDLLAIVEEEDVKPNESPET